jgi:Tfp pilus assembly protein PilW
VSALTAWRHLRVAARRLRRCERGITMTELTVSMAVMSIVVAGLVTLFTAGANSEAQLNLRFQSQTDARTALEAFRRDVHNACSATVVGGTRVTLYTLNTAAASYPCTVVSASWCTSGTGTRYGLYRSGGSATCSSGNERRADYVTGGSIFAVQTGSGELPKVTIDMTVNREPYTPRLAYRLDDAISLRNARRT